MMVIFDCCRARISRVTLAVPVQPPRRRAPMMVVFNCCRARISRAILAVPVQPPPDGSSLVGYAQALYYWGLRILEITYQVGVGTDGTKQNRGVKRRSADDGRTDVRTSSHYTRGLKHKT
jgi:hypothetical protein